MYVLFVWFDLFVCKLVLWFGVVVFVFFIVGFYVGFVVVFIDV